MSAQMRFRQSIRSSYNPHAHQNNTNNNNMGATAQSSGFSSPFPSLYTNSLLQQQQQQQANNFGFSQIWNQGSNFGPQPAMSSMAAVAIDPGLVVSFLF